MSWRIAVGPAGIWPELQLLCYCYSTPCAGDGPLLLVRGMWSPLLLRACRILFALIPCLIFTLSAHAEPDVDRAIELTRIYVAAPGHEAVLASEALDRLGVSTEPEYVAAVLELIAQAGRRGFRRAKYKICLGGYHVTTTSSWFKPPCKVWLTEIVSTKFCCRFWSAPRARPRICISY